VSLRRRDINKEIAENIGPLERVAVWITEHVGTMGFFLVIFVWTALWLGWNLLAPPALQFDPPMAFAFWLFLSNEIQMLLMPLIILGQNIRGRHAETRAENDLEVNIKAERETEVILRHLEYQNRILIAMLERLGSAWTRPCARQRPDLSGGRSWRSAAGNTGPN